MWISFHQLKLSKLLRFWKQVQLFRFAVVRCRLQFWIFRISKSLRLLSTFGLTSLHTTWITPPTKWKIQRYLLFSCNCWVTDAIVDLRDIRRKVTNYCGIPTSPPIFTEEIGHKRGARRCTMLKNSRKRASTGDQN